jgi:small subunit ribosomal protein S6e
MFEVDTITETRLYDKEIGDQFPGDILGETFKGCVLEISGGDDILGLPMVKKYRTKKRLRVLLSGGDVGYRCRRKGTRKRKSVRGSIVSEEIGVLNLKLVQAGEKEITGLTDQFREVNQLPTSEKNLRAMFEVPDSCEDTIAYIKNYLKENNVTLRARLPRDDKFAEMKRKKAEMLEARARKRDANRRKLEEERAEYQQKYPNLNKA